MIAGRRHLAALTTGSAALVALLLVSAAAHATATIGGLSFSPTTVTALHEPVTYELSLVGDSQPESIVFSTTLQVTGASPGITVTLIRSVVVEPTPVICGGRWSDPAAAPLSRYATYFYRADLAPGASGFVTATDSLDRYPLVDQQPLSAAFVFGGSDAGSPGSQSFAVSSAGPALAGVPTLPTLTVSVQPPPGAPPVSPEAIVRPFAVTFRPRQPITVSGAINVGPGRVVELEWFTPGSSRPTRLAHVRVDSRGNFRYVIRGRHRLGDYTVFARYRANDDSWASTASRCGAPFVVSAAGHDWVPARQARTPPAPRIGTGEHTA